MTKIFILGATVSALASGALAFDDAAARAIYRSPKNSCAKCHAIDKEKDGPALHKVAEKYKGDAEAEHKLIRHLTTGKMVKFPDGHEEEHRLIEERDPEVLKNFVQWILAQ